MGRLIVGIREAEERLAAIGRALQSAFEEEIRDATHARDAANRGLARAQAMETAATSLGQDEMVMKIVELTESLKASEAAASRRLAELAALEKAVQLRLADPEGGAHIPVPMLPPAPVVSATPPPVKARPPDDLLSRQTQLLGRVKDLEKIAPKWEKDVARLGIQEHVALAHLIGKRFEVAGRKSDSQTAGALDRLKALAATLELTEITGFGDETADWSKLASDARTQRATLVESRKKPAEPAPPPA